MREQTNFHTMRELPVLERPYERCEKYGPESLTDAQLLAILLRTGSSRQSALELSQSILCMDGQGGKGLGNLFHMKYPDFSRIPGIGKVKAVTLLAAVELARRLAMTRSEKTLVFNDVDSVASYYIPALSHEEQEHLYCLFLDTRNGLIKELCLTKGTVNSSLASTRDIMREALRYGAVKIIIMHNHPSGDPSPSGVDIEVTKKINQACRLLDLELIDHIVIGDHRYTSMYACGIIDDVME